MCRFERLRVILTSALIVFIAIDSICMEDNNPVVTTTQGQIRGKTLRDVEGNIFYGFQGIPYAAPPVGNLRFKAPQPPEPWQGIRDGTIEGPQCVQMSSVADAPVGSEDCLFLNVYTKQIPDSSNNFKPKPVMFWIHGGGFTIGSGKSDIYGPNILLTRDIILVTINYRLNIFGFLSFEDPSIQIPGNAGLKDVVQALKWVRENIKSFGGDPDTVTIFGQNAGGAIVHLLMLSPMGKGLFHRAISMSGSALNVWVFTPRRVDNLANALKHKPSLLERGVYEAIKDLPAEDLMMAQNYLVNQETNPLGTWSPIVAVLEDPSGSEEPFITERPEKIIAEGRYTHVPYIFGITYDDKGAATHTPGNIAKIKINITNTEKLVATNLGIEMNTDRSRVIDEKIKQFYWGDAKSVEDTWKSLFEFQSDVAFIQPIFKSVKTQVLTSTQPIYFYKFAWSSTLSIVNKLVGNDNEDILRGDELGYLFNTEFFSTEIINNEDTQEHKASDQIVTLWTNFAKTGNPNIPKRVKSMEGIEWMPVTRNEFNYLVIGPTVSVNRDPFAKRTQFWNELYDDVASGRI